MKNGNCPSGVSAAPVSHSTCTGPAKLSRLTPCGGPLSSTGGCSPVGSGKSLAFLSWAFEILARDDEATLIATFPTQALLWNQAKRLAAISDEGSQVTYPGMGGICFAGTITIGNISIPWTVWYGMSQSEEMRIHAASGACKNARLRLSTLDNVHWNLMQKNEAYFLSHLGGLVIDGAHSWQSVLDNAAAEFRAVGRIPLRLGWKAVYKAIDPDVEAEAEQTLPSLSDGETAILSEPRVEAKRTQPPPR